MKKLAILTEIADLKNCLYQAERDESYRWGDIFDALTEGGVSADYAQKMIRDYDYAVLEADRFRREIAALEAKLPARLSPSPVPECPEGVDYMSHLAACNCD